MIKAVMFDADGMVVKGGRFSDHFARDYGISPKATATFLKTNFRSVSLEKRT